MRRTDASGKWIDEGPYSVERGQGSGVQTRRLDTPASQEQLLRIRRAYRASAPSGRTKGRKIKFKHGQPPIVHY